MHVPCVERRIGGTIRAFSKRTEEIREVSENGENGHRPSLLRRRDVNLDERSGVSHAFEQRPETREMSVSQLERTLFTMLWMAFTLAILCTIVFALGDDRSFAYSGGIIFAFCLAALVSRRMLAFGHIQGAVAVVCLAILAALFLMVFVMPHIYQTIVVTALLTSSLALPYTGDYILRWLMVGSWIGAIAVGTVGPFLLSRMSPEDTRFDVLFGTLTIAAAAGLSLLILWQFRSRLMLSLTQARSAEEQMSHAATHDTLTGLPNRSLLANDLEGAMDGIREEYSESFAVLFLDLDRFKHVNDSLGHTLGDELLKMVAARISECLGSNDTISRMGGDEFVVVLRDANREDAERVATRIQNTLKMPFKLYGHELYAAATIGIVVDTGEYARPDDLIRDADTAMYQAKHAGKGRHAVFDTNMRREAVSLLRLENELRSAVEHGRFVVHYQPIVWLASGGVVGFEALTRWDHPERGVLAPSEFMQMAEETGIIHDIDRLTLKAACRQTAIWREEFPAPFPPSINVNISPSGLSRAGLVEEIERVLAETGLPGYALVLELTEGAIMQDSDNGLRILRELRSLGVRIHVDDFGTGYSSLALLHRLPVDALKIDRSFVSGMGENGGLENAEIVRTILTMAHALGMDVVAEGVETSEHLELLRKMGCDYVQGYRFSRPVRRDKARAILAAEPVW